MCGNIFSSSRKDFCRSIFCSIAPPAGAICRADALYLIREKISSELEEYKRWESVIAATAFENPAEGAFDTRKAFAAEQFNAHPSAHRDTAKCMSSTQQGRKARVFGFRCGQLMTSRANLETQTAQDSRASSIQPGTPRGESGIVFCRGKHRQSAQRRL
jgi:hypothetical protein